jgi:hypothetical protein
MSFLKSLKNKLWPINLFGQDHPYLDGFHCERNESEDDNQKSFLIKFSSNEKKIRFDKARLKSNLTP